jgi:methylated-DNA-[protein]-cysteine S-methyltransferase
MLLSKKSFIDTPIGVIEISASERGITSVVFAEKAGKSEGGFAHLDAAAKQIAEYFSSKRTAFHDLTLAMTGTEFSQNVWSEVLKIPFGKTATYGELAVRIAKEGAARAVGGALGRNPFAIIVPCHRVIAAGSSDSDCDNLGGFAWGAERKKWLLEHERINV